MNKSRDKLLNLAENFGFSLVDNGCGDCGDDNMYNVNERDLLFIIEYMDTLLRTCPVCGYPPVLTETKM